MTDSSNHPEAGDAALHQGEYGYPVAHLGHLNAEQEKALIDFKDLAAREGLYHPASADKPSSHDDAVMLRFLRARRFVPPDALHQFQETEKWRKVNRLDELYWNIDVEHYDEARRLYPQWTGRRDKRGLPLFLFCVKPLDSKTMATYAKSSAEIQIADNPDAASADKKDTADVPKDASAKTPPRLLRLFALYEYLASFMLQLCTNLHDRPYTETPVSQSNNIVDISGVGLKQFWNLRSHMQDASLLATAHYPETLDRIFIVGAPAFFPTVWGWIKRWFDPITVSKIFILSQHDIYPTLSTFIDPASIPKQYGGTLDFAYGQDPPIDPAYAQQLEWKPGHEPKDNRWPSGPMSWIERDDGTLDLIAVGSINGKARRDILATFRPEKTTKPKANAPGGTAETSPLATEEAKSDAATTAAPASASSDNKPNTQTNPVEPHVEPVPLDATATPLPTETGKETVAAAGTTQATKDKANSTDPSKDIEKLLVTDSAEDSTATAATANGKA